MAADFCEDVQNPRRTIQISVHAYECLPGLVFVRVPNERGRYMLVERCVVEVDCKLCGAISGEPCHNRKRERRYHIGTHGVRREDWKKLGGNRSTKPKPKIHIAADDYLGAYTDPDPDQGEHPCPN